MAATPRKISRHSARYTCTECANQYNTQALATECAARDNNTDFIAEWTNSTTDRKAATA